MVTTQVCDAFTPHIKASTHATYIMLHSLGVLQLPMDVIQLSIGMQIILLYTLIHNALSHSSNWLHIQGINLCSIVGETLGQCSSTVLTYNALPICTNNLANNCDKYLWYSIYQYCYYGNESVT